MFYILTIVISILLGVIDGCMSSTFACFFILLLGLLGCFKVKGSSRSTAFKLNSIVVFGYIIMAFVVSRSFLNGDTFYISDPSRYIANYGQWKTFFYNWDNIIECYTDFSDSNALYNAYLLAISVFANNFLFGTSEFFMTLGQTIFGILSINVLFRILLIYFDEEKSYKYALSFAFCSLFLIYSSVVLRDIIIAYFYIRAIEIVLHKFNPKGLISLFVFMALTWGIRLYSGLFFASFIALYFYLYARNTSFKKLSIALFLVVGLVGAVGIFGSSIIIDKTADEMKIYSEMTQERALEKGGLFTLFYSLPQGIRQITILFYSQMAPFPPYGHLVTVGSFSNFVIAIDVILYEIFWFLIFYTLVMAIVSRKVLKSFSVEELLLFAMVIVFIIANTSHPDIRRMMPMYPITYLLYIKVKESVIGHAWVKSTHKGLLACYVSLLVVYIALKGL